MCNIFGITYHVSTQPMGFYSKIARYLIAVPVFLIHLCLILKMMLSGYLSESNFYYCMHLVSIGDKIEITSSAILLYAKGIYYFIRRNALKNLLLQVSTTDKLLQGFV